MMKSERSHIAATALAALLMLAVLLAACGGGGAPQPASPSEGDTNPGSGAPAEMGSKVTATPTAAPAANAVYIDIRSGGTSKGDFLVDGNGISLYKSYQDEKDKSNCTGDCLTNWPPVLVDSPDQVVAKNKTWLDGKLGTIPAEGGKYQVTFKHHPLYYSILDTKMGDTNGQAVDENWYLVAPTSN